MPAPRFRIAGGGLAGGGLAGGELAGGELAGRELPAVRRLDARCVLDVPFVDGSDSGGV